MAEVALHSLQGYLLEIELELVTADWETRVLFFLSLGRRFEVVEN